MSAHRRLAVPDKTIFRGGFDSILRAWWRAYWEDDTPERCQRKAPEVVLTWGDAQPREEYAPEQLHG